ncbi:MAG: sulfite exporter TauE/SafE family protein [Candidatus Binatia bacterium]
MLFDTTTVVVGAALLLAAFVKGTTGFGFPLIATPMAALLLDIRTAITILIIPNIVMDIGQIFRGGFPTPILRRFSWLLVLTVFGVFLGTKVLVILPIWVLNLSLATMIFVFVASSFLRFDFRISPPMEKLLSPVLGFLAGFLNGMTTAAGPPLAIYLYGLRLPKTEFVRSIATIFLITKLSQLVAVSTWNLFTFSTLRLSLQVTLFCLLGFYVGLKTQDRVNQQTFNRGLLALLCLIGVMLVVRSVR